VTVEDIATVPSSMIRTSAIKPSRPSSTTPRHIFIAKFNIAAGLATTKDVLHHIIEHTMVGALISEIGLSSKALPPAPAAVPPSPANNASPSSGSSGHGPSAPAARPSPFFSPSFAQRGWWNTPNTVIFYSFSGLFLIIACVAALITISRRVTARRLALPMTATRRNSLASTPSPMSPQVKPAGSTMDDLPEEGVPIEESKRWERFDHALEEIV
jgi:hypothetical protein